MKPPKYTLKGCGDLEPVDEGDVQMEYSYEREESVVNQRN